jgi:hypothetical protein
MSWTKLTVAALCLPVVLLGACSSSNKKGGGSTTTTIAHPDSGTVAPSAWKDVAEGKFRTKAWKVAAAKSSTGWRCFDATGSAAADTTTTTVAGAPSRNGRAAVCLPPAGDTTSEPFVAFVNGNDANQWVVVGAVADGVKRVSIGFADGTRTPLNIDPKSRLVIWKGPASVKPKDIKTDSVTCAIDPAQKSGKTALCAGVSSS